MKILWYERLIARGRALGCAAHRGKDGEWETLLIEMKPTILSPTVLEYQQIIRKRYEENK